MRVCCIHSLRSVALAAGWKTDGKRVRLECRDSGLGGGGLVCRREARGCSRGEAGFSGVGWADYRFKVTKSSGNCISSPLFSLLYVMYIVGIMYYQLIAQ